MKKIIVMMVCVVFLTVGRIWAQEADTNAVVDNAQVNEMIDNEAAVNDEGYGTDDEEYYGSEDDAVNAVVNEEQMNDDLTNADESK